VAEGWSTDTANAVLSAIFQQTAYAVAGLWVQLHTGAPGAAGTSNIATNNTRKDATACFGTDPVGGSITNDADIGPWLSVPASETYTHATLWTASTSGTFVMSGAIAAAAVTIGDDFPIPSGDLTCPLPVAS
jgi:hypothetical protein